jgi:hypothetical protein
MKPKNTTWFSKFMLNEYEDDQWVENLKTLKSMFFHIANELRPTLMKKNRKYINAIPMEIRMSCYLQACAWMQFFNL